MRAGTLGLALLAALALTFAAPPSRAAAEMLTIKNDKLQVNVDAASGRFTLTALPSGKVFVTDGQLSQPGGEALATTAEDLVFGQGQAIVVRFDQGVTDSIMLFPGVPFAIVVSKLHNGAQTPLTVNRFTALTTPLDLGLPLEKLSVLGTGGLARMNNGVLKAETVARPKKASAKKTSKSAPKKKTSAGATPGAAKNASKAPQALETPKPTYNIPPTKPGDELGSYVWLAAADPQTRNGVVGAWLTGDRASGVVFPRVDKGNLALEAQLHYGNLLLAPGKTETLEMFALGWFDDARLGLEEWAGLVAKHYKIHLPAQPAGYCTWYMEKYRGASDEKHFAELSEYAAKNLTPFGFNFVQIDDGWQDGLKKNGPKKNFNQIDQTAKSPYPSGMKATADMAKRLGLAPGIWFMPFAGNYEDPFFADKQDLFVKHKDGTPYETSWGGTCMDLTNPKTQAYLRQMVGRIAHDWGYTLFKMDGMWTGTATPQIYVNNGYKEDGMGDAVLHNPAMTNIEAYRAGIRTVREAAGKDVFILGCCVPQNMRSFGGAFGLVDAFRIGPDTGSGNIGSPHASRQYFLNGRVWYNDPDCVSVRTSHPLGNARANASFTAISGNLYYNSDWIPDLPAERLDILKRTMLPHGLPGRPVDLFEQSVARMWLLSDTRSGHPRRDVVAFFNWDPKYPATIEATLAHIGLDPAREYVAFDFWENKYLGAMKDKLAMTVPADSCAILAVRPASEVPQLLSTSFHVTQGMVDVPEEKWNEEAKTLSGTSKVVANDPYELRIALPEGWKVKEAKAEGLKAEVKSEAGLARVSFTSPESKDVRWTVSCEK